MSAFDELRMSAPDVEAALREALEEASHMIYGELAHDHPTAIKVRAALAASRTAETGEPEGERLEGWVGYGVSPGLEFAENNGTFTPGPTSRPATLIIHAAPPAWLRFTSR